jgi:hypothetical protein
MVSIVPRLSTIFPNLKSLTGLPNDLVPLHGLPRTLTHLHMRRIFNHGILNQLSNLKHLKLSLITTETCRALNRSSMQLETLSLNATPHETVLFQLPELLRSRSLENLQYFEFTPSDLDYYNIHSEDPAAQAIVDTFAHIVHAIANHPTLHSFRLKSPLVAVWLDYFEVSSHLKSISWTFVLIPFRGAQLLGRAAAEQGAKRLILEAMADFEPPRLKIKAILTQRKRRFLPPEESDEGSSDDD